MVDNIDGLGIWPCALLGRLRLDDAAQLLALCRCLQSCIV